MTHGFGRFMSLYVKKTKNGSTRLVLDGRELIGVKRYEIKSTALKGKSELLVELMVNFPPDSQEQGNAYISEQGKISGDEHFTKVQCDTGAERSQQGANIERREYEK